MMAKLEFYFLNMVTWAITNFVIIINYTSWRPYSTQICEI